MAKIEKPAETPVVQDVNEELAFQAAFDANKDNMRRVTTREGRLRGQLSPNDRALGRQILKSYGL